MTTSTPPAELVILSATSAFSGKLLNLLIYIFAGVAVFRASTHANFFSCLAVLIFSLAIALALGVAAATLQVAYQKGSALIWLLGSGLWLLSGTMFPVNSLPYPLQILARLIPITYAIDGARKSLLEGQSPASMSSTLAVLGGFSIFMLPLALAALSFSIRRARRNGTLSFY
jgi:ABC-2 type transport system permease protein